ETTPSQTTGSSSHEIIEGYLTDTCEDGISLNDHDIAEFHRSRKYSVRCVVVPTLDEVEIVKSRHFLAILCQASMIEAGRDQSPLGLWLGAPESSPALPPRVQGLLSLVMEIGNHDLRLRPCRDVPIHRGGAALAINANVWRLWPMRR